MLSISRVPVCSAARKMNSLAPPNLVKKPNTSGSLLVSRAKGSSEVPPSMPSKILPAGGWNASACAAGASASESKAARAAERRRMSGTSATGARSFNPRLARVPGMSDGLAPGPDGELRCWWGVSTPEYVAYHDDEWGRPVRDDRGLYERLCLEAFQSGLSWLTILRKREAFRAAFAGFEIEAVAAFGDEDVTA